MIFTSYTYIAFLLSIFILHWTALNQWRKPVLVAASFVFYCSWRWEFGFLLLAVCLFNWSYARFVLAKFPSEGLLTAGVAVNLAPLIYFKYTGFIIENIAGFSHAIGWKWSPVIPDIFLPLGISFFSFQGIAYLIDIATGEKSLERFSDFLLFKSFWPQLIAGPIIRLHEIRDAIETPRSLEYDNLAIGCQRILFGLFKKVVIADSLAPTVDMVFSSPTAPNFVDALVGILAFGLQIYFDFSAYSDIAIGSASLFGYQFPENFKFPYLSTSPQEFWQRWHITLSNWIRDYVFTPLTFASRNQPGLANVWLILAMALCGLWHGANWTYVLWGVWHGLLLVLNNTLLKRFFPRRAVADGNVFPLRHICPLITTYVLVNLGWVFFRSNSLEQCGQIFQSLFTFRGGRKPSILVENQILAFGLFWFGTVVFHVFHERVKRLVETLTWAEWGWRLTRPVLYTFIILAVIIFDSESKTFVYFQF